MKSSQESKRMETSAEIRTAMWSAFPPRPSDNRKSWLASVARSLGWNQRRVKALFYCEARVVTADEWRTINARLDAAKKRERERDELRTAHRSMGQVLPVDARENDEPAELPFEASAVVAAAKRQA